MKTVFPAALLFCSLSNAQQASVVPRPDIERLRQEQVQARDALQREQREWVSRDPDLEKELSTGDPDQLLQRLHEKEQSRGRVDDAKQRFYSATRKELEAILNLVRTPADGKPVKSDEIRADLAGQKSHLQEQRVLLEKNLNNIDSDVRNTALRTATQQELDATNRLLLTLNDLDSILGSVKQGETGADAALTQVTDGYRKLLDSLSKDQELAADIASATQSIYKKEETMVEARRATVPSPPAPRSDSPGPPPNEPALAPVDRPTLPDGIYAGTWELDGYSEDTTLKKSRLVLNEAGGRITGTYEAELEHEGKKTTFKVSVDGVVKPDEASVTWRGENALGAMTFSPPLKPGAGGTMEIHHTQSTMKDFPENFSEVVRRK